MKKKLPEWKWNGHTSGIDFKKNVSRLRSLWTSHVLTDSWSQGSKHAVHKVNSMLVWKAWVCHLEKTGNKLPDTLTVSHTAHLSKSHTNCTSPCWNADQCSRTLFSCSHPVQHNVYCGISDEPLLGAIMISNIWHANFSGCKCTDTHSCTFLDVICTIHIELHYFNMKITTTWTFSCDSNMESGHHSMWQHVSLLSIYCGSGTSRSANHNTVGTMIALPSLHANVVSRLSSPFPHPLFVLVVLFFFRMEILRSIGAACSGRMAPQRG